VHAVTSLTEKKASAEALAGLARGQWGIESVHGVRDTAWDQDANTGYAGNGPQAMATLRNLAVSLLYLAGGKKRSPAPSKPSHATETAYSTTYRYETQVSNDFGDPVPGHTPI
jgi:hypothetical protein